MNKIKAYLLLLTIALSLLSLPHVLVMTMIL